MENVSAFSIQLCWRATARRGVVRFQKKSVLLYIWELREVLETPVTLAVLADASVGAAAVDVKSVIYTADNVASSADVSTCAAPEEELRASGLRVGAPRARR